MGGRSQFMGGEVQNCGDKKKWRCRFKLQGKALKKLRYFINEYNKEKN